MYFRRILPYGIHILATILLLSLLCSCGTSHPDSNNASEPSQIPIDSAILELMNEETAGSIMIPSAVEDIPAPVPGASEEDAPVTTQDNSAPSEAVSSELTQLLETFYDSSTAENTIYEGLILSLYRFDRSWYENNEAVASDAWPIWDYGVTHYPYARDAGNLYMLSLPMLPDTDLSNAACVNSYKAAQEDTLDTLKEYAAAKGLTLNPSLDADYSTFLSQIWRNSASQPSSAQSAADPVLEKLNSAAVSGSFPQAARDAFYNYLTAPENQAFLNKVMDWIWSVTEDTKSKYTGGWIRLDFDGTSGAAGFYYGNSIYYRPDTGAVLTFEETDAYIGSMSAESNPAISAKLSAVFSPLGTYDQEAFDTMLRFLSSSDGSWMWDKCLEWSWECSYDSATNRYSLHCTGPLEADGTKGVQSLVVQGSQIIGYPSGYINAAGASDSSDTAPEASPES